MSSSYIYCYDATQYEGKINDIEVRWAPAGQAKLPNDAGVLQVPMETIKRMCEHYGYLLGYRLQSTRVVIKSGPHSFSVDSKTGKRSNDGDHFTVEVSGGPNGRRKAHVYLNGHGFGVGAYDNIGVRAESVMDKKGKSIDMTLSSGNASLAGGSGSGYGVTADNAGAGASSGTATSGAGAWGSTYGTTAGNAGPSSSGQGGTYTEWQLASDGQTWIRYNHGTGGWEDQYGRALG